MTTHYPDPNRNRNPGPTPAPLPHPGNPHDARWIPPHDQDVVNEVHRFLQTRDGTTVISMYDATSEFAGDAWIETDAFVPLTEWE